MINYLKGKIFDIIKDSVILEVNGVGYKVEGLDSLVLKEGQELELYVYTHLTQQDIRLFGFPTKEEYLLFIDLLKVSGVGPKTAAVLLNRLGADDVKMAIAKGDYEHLKVPGIGTKTAQKIVVELTGTYKNIDAGNYRLEDRQLQEDIISALKDLGFTRDEVEKAFARIDNIEELSEAELLKTVLTKLKNKK
jgi:Holliday junction DNA helicase RuvA